MIQDWLNVANNEYQVVERRLLVASKSHGHHRRVDWNCSRVWGKLMKVLNFELDLLELVIIAWCPVKLSSIQSLVIVLLVVQE
jgi:hypothetical protein